MQTFQSLLALIKIKKRMINGYIYVNKAFIPKFCNWLHEFFLIFNLGKDCLHEQLP